MHKVKGYRSKVKGLIEKLKFLLLTCTFTLYLLPFTLTCFAQDKIVAIVNNDIITQKDLNDFVNFMRVQLETQYKDKELENKIQSIKLDLLEKLIEDRLVLQDARKSKIRIEESRVRARLDEIKRRYSSDLEFQKALSRQGLTQADIEAKIGEQLLMYNVIDEKIRSKIIVNPTEVTDFYQKNAERLKIPEVRQVTLVSTDNEKTAGQIYEGLKNGVDLNELAQKYSALTDKMNVSQTGELIKDIEDVVFKLQLNEISQPVKINESFYIFRLDNIKACRQQNLSEVQDKIYTFLFETKMQENLLKWVESLRKQSYIKIFQNQ